MMRNIIGATLLLTLACAGKHVPTEAPAKVNPNYVLRIVGRFGLGHACPTDGLILSAAHVVNPFYQIPTLSSVLVGYSWSDMTGRTGYVVGQAVTLSRDLGLFSAGSGQPGHYRHSTEEPSPGDVLQWIEYDHESLESAYAPRLRQATLIRPLAGYLVLDSAPVKGASGSCLFNSQGEVVGIIAWGVRTGSGDAVGVAVSVSGPWWPGSP